MKTEKSADLEAKSENCEHNFVFSRSSKYDEYRNYNTKFVRIDYYYCTKCLTYECVKQEDYCRDTPDWYRN